MIHPLVVIAASSALAIAQCTTVIVPLPGGTNGSVVILRQLANGDILIGGDFTTLLGVPCNRIARWNGITVAPLGSGLDARASTAIELPNGDLVVGGSFQTAGGAAIPHLARWDGTSWSGFGSGPGGEVVSVAVRPNGEIFAGTRTLDRARRWDGVQWINLPVTPFPPFPLPVNAMHTLPNGDVLLSSPFLLQVPGAVYNIARWDGTTLHGMPVTTPSYQLSGDAERFVTLRDGTLAATGAWMGSLIVEYISGGWTPLPGASAAFGGASDLCELPDGDLVMCGSFLYVGSNQQARGVVRRHNGAWGPFGSGIVGSASCLLPLPSGEVLVGGNMTVVDGQPAQALALLVPTCRATAAPIGNGCVGSGGQLSLVPTSLPYCGSIQRSRATGLPTNALGVGILGYSAIAIALPTLLPQGVAGCMLLASPDDLTLLPASGGEAHTAITVPNVPALVGITLRQQVASVELGTSGSITAVATSNALTLVIGSF